MCKICTEMSLPNRLRACVVRCRFITDRLQSLPARGSLTAACLICSTLSYIGWTSINVFSISSESQFIGASRIVLPSQRSHLAWYEGLRVGGRLALLYIHQMNRVNSRNGLVMMTAL